MIYPAFLSLIVGAVAIGAPGVALQPQPQAPATSAPAAPPNVVEDLRAEAEKLKPLTISELARAFLDAAGKLPDPGVRVLMRNREKNLTLGIEAYEKLAEAERAGFVKREFPAKFYYYTGYGTPLVYARVLDVLAENDKGNWTPEKLAGKRIADFGAGTIGHLRQLASLGADVTGIDVEPMFDALYSQAGDQGEITGPDGKKGYLRFLTGQWPANQEIVAKVKERAGDGYDLFVSKNTLKRGYIHPARETDPSRLVHLGVTDEVFVKTVYDTLKPGGIFFIYNISPAQTPADKPYLPHADGESPFPRELLEKTGFEIIKFDEEDRDEVLKYWMALGYNQGKDAEAAKADLFAWWTMCRKPVKKTAGADDERIKITRNYAAEFNAKIEAIPDDERAWPLYKAARMKLVMPSDELREAGWAVRPSHERWEEALRNLEANEECLRLVREAAERPHLGLTMSDQPDPELETFFAGQRGEKVELVAPSENPMVYTVLLPHLSDLRTYMRLLIIDSHRASQAGDGARIVANARTIVALAEHAPELPTLISSLVKIALQGELVKVAAEQVGNQPQVLSDAQLTELANLFQTIDARASVIESLKHERLTLLDFLQRAYSDDGNGDGVMTSSGWELFQLITSGTRENARPLPSSYRKTTAGRAETLAAYDKFAAEQIPRLKLERWEWKEWPGFADDLSSMDEKRKWVVVDSVMPAFKKAALALTQLHQQRDAARTAIALELYKRRYGRFPQRLASLVPTFIDEVPVDCYDGGPLKYRLEDGKPILYSVGTDRDDDGGRHDPNDSWAANRYRTPSEVDAARRGNADAPAVPDADWPLWRAAAIHPAFPEARIRVARHFVDEHNAEVDALPEVDRAWDIYRIARMKLVPATRELTDAGWPVFPGEANFAAAVENLKQNEEAIRLIRDAAKRPSFGVAMDRADPELDEFLAKESGLEYTPRVARECPMMYDCLIPQLGHLRHFTRLLVMDSRRAFAEGDPEAFMANTLAIAGMSKHAAEIPSLIAALVSVAINSQLTMVAREMLEISPDLLSAEQLDELRVRLAGLQYIATVKEGVVAERDVFYDAVQRIYTDDGKGDGVMTAEGWKVIAALRGDLENAKPVPDFIKAAMVGRAKMLAEHDRLLAETLALAERPMWEWENSPNLLVEERLSTSAQKAKYGLIAIMTPAIGKSITSARHGEQQRDGAIVALAIEQHRRARSAYPATLDELVPQLLAAIPRDHFDAAPLKYRLIDGKPVVYSIGVDRDDDGGRVDERDTHGPGQWRSHADVEDLKKNPGKSRRVADGDWVLWPIPENQR